MIILDFYNNSLAKNHSRTIEILPLPEILKELLFP